MLSDRNIREINSQISRELRDLNSPFTSSEKKVDILDRVARLKSLLNQQPTQDELIAQLADALTHRVKKPEATLSETIADALLNLRR